MHGVPTAQANCSAACRASQKDDVPTLRSRLARGCHAAYAWRVSLATLRTTSTSSSGERPQGQLVTRPPRERVSQRRAELARLSVLEQVIVAERPSSRPLPGLLGASGGQRGTEPADG